MGRSAATAGWSMAVMKPQKSGMISKDNNDSIVQRENTQELAPYLIMLRCWFLL
jgi:hypothetical protein